jgi:hypothetical protein
VTDFGALLEGLVGPIAAFLLTIMVLSYLIGDNPFFRVAMHTFVGVASGYAGAIAIRNVLIPGLIDPWLRGDLAGMAESARSQFLLLNIGPWALVLLLLLKLVPGAERLGALPMAFLVGVGAAVVVGGAITGTLIPQSMAAMNTLSPFAVSPQTGETGLERMFNITVTLVATTTTLLYFRFTVHPLASGEGDLARVVKVLSYIGRIFIAVTFGVMYAGALAATLVVLAERFQFLRNVILGIMAGLRAAG